LGVLVAVVGLGLGIGWLATRDVATVPPVEPPQPEAVNSTTVPRPATRPNPARPAPAPPSRPADPQPVAEPEVVAVPLAQPEKVVTNWEDSLEEVLASDDEDTDKVTQLLTMFPRLPAEGQDEVAQHLSNLVEDENYAPLLRLAVDATLPEEVLDTLLADLLNRPNATKLPAFLDIAFTPNHPKAEEARDLLELYLEENYGTDRATWQKKTEEWLKENPD